MDNFMDKLAEKYNAQDMIRANSQAETAQMQSLQDQVEAYEAVLQEMRKLNYKNTELTEKMYALVDASIEKVRTLQIEASEGSVDTAEVTREMQDAVNQAVSEAISNMDETMARTLAQSLQQPTDEMRQSNERMAEDVRNSLETSLQAVQDSVESLRSSGENVDEKLQNVDAQIAGVKEEVSGVREDIREISAATDLLIEAVTKQDEVKAPQEIMDGLRDLSAQIAGLKAEEKPEEVSNQEILDAVRKSDNTAVESIGAVAATVAALKAGDQSGQVLEKLGELSAQIEALKEAGSNNDTAEQLLEVATQIEELKNVDKSAEVAEKLQEVSTQIGALQEEDKNKAVLDKLQELSSQIDALKEKEEEAVRFNADAFKAPEVSNQEILDAVRNIATTSAGDKADLLDELKIADNAIRDRLFAIQQSNTTTEETLASVVSAVAALREDNGPAEAPQEILDKLADLSAQITELKEAGSNNDTAEQLLEVATQIEELKNADKSAEVAEKLQAVSAEIAALKESSLRTEAPQEVLDKLQEVSTQIGALQEEDKNKAVLEKLQELSAQIDALREKEEEAVRFNADAFKEPEISNQEILDAVRKIESAGVGNKEDLLDELKTADNAIQDRLFAIQQSNTTTEETLASVASAVAALRDDNGPAEAPQEVLDKLADLSEQVEALKAEDKNAQVLDKIRELSEQIAGMQEESVRFHEDAVRAPEVSNQEILEAVRKSDNTDQVLEKLQALATQSDKIYAKQQEPDEDARAAAAQVAELLETLKQQAKFTELTQETLSALAQSNTQTQDSLTEMRSKLDGMSDRSAEEKSAAEMAEKLTAVQQDAKSAKEALFYLRTSSDEQKGGIEELKGLGNDTKAGLQDIYDSLEKAKKGISDIKAQQLQMQPQANEGDDEIRQALTELLSGHSELTTGLRNVKNASDDTKNTLKSTLDTAIYGLKQDNKELIGILQRMNATLTSRTNDDEKEQRKAEEERARIEEDRRLLEERFKLTEDFMHKESVKVYRNVQAVINEKNDKQRENMDGGNQNVMSSVAKAKAWAIISTIVGGANLVLMVLKILGIV